MKTLREYIDQLDEISRRDFLKGVGATAAGAAIGGVAYMNRGKSNFEGNDGVYIDQILRLYYVSKEFSRTPNEYPGASEIQQICKQLIRQYLDANPKMKNVIDNEYKLIVNHANQDAATNYEKAFAYDQMAWNNRNNTIKTFKDFLQGKDPLFQPGTKEFDESKDLEEASPDAVARIEELIKYK